MALDSPQMENETSGGTVSLLKCREGFSLREALVAPNTSAKANGRLKSAPRDCILRSSMVFTTR